MQDAFFGSVGREHIRIPYRNVLYIIASNNYCVVVNHRLEKIHIHCTLSCLEEILPTHLFMRVHRSYIISLAKVDKLQKDTVTIRKEQIPINERCKELLQKRLNVAPSDCGCRTGKSKNSKTDAVGT